MPAAAFEYGYIGSAQKPGLMLGGSAATPPPGTYVFSQVLGYSGSLVGPGAPGTGDDKTPVKVAGAAVGAVWVPGWTVLGADYEAVLVQPFMNIDVGAPIDVGPTGIHNTYVSPIGLSWKLGDSGLYVKAGLGIWLPTGTTEGANGLENIGAPWWTFQPNLTVSYVKDGWNLSANIFQEINTANSITGYTSGNVLHAEFTATKTVGNWTLGPVAYYAGQVTDDQSSDFYNHTVNLNRYDIWAVGAMVGYNFGSANLNVWATTEVSAAASGGTPQFGQDSAAVSRGFTVFASLSSPL